MGTDPEFDEGWFESGRINLRIRCQSPLCSDIFQGLADALDLFGDGLLVGAPARRNTKGGLVENGFDAADLAFFDLK